MRTDSGGDRESALQSGWTVEGREEPVIEPSTPPEPAAVEAEPSDASANIEERTQLSNVAVLGLGLVGGLYLLYAGIWMTWARYYADVNAAAAAGSGSIGGVLQQIVFWIAPLAPILWFVSAIALYRKQRRVFALVLVLGLVLLLPLPMIFANGAAL